ncbi:hypothetical protein [Rhizobium binae]|uniref:hypothetical protein n=1 Tax=Rhizobium binae TaxID=1138190 RepID=UPI001C8332DF|nr:hypothetical protein [Rhizobium binae]MBX4924424.1 hypothetical protein [Rhizobium binae]
MATKLDALLRSLEELDHQIRRLREIEMSPEARHRQMVDLMAQHRRLSLLVLRQLKLRRLDGSEHLSKQASRR